MKMSTTRIGASGRYYDVASGRMCYHSTVTAEARADGKFFKHYYANLGNMTEEIGITEYNEIVKAIREQDGKVTTHWSRATMKVWEKTSDVEVFAN